MLLRELEEYEKSQGQKDKKEEEIKDKMLVFMTDYYERMKLDMNIDANYAVETDDPSLDEVLR